MYLIYSALLAVVLALTLPYWLIQMLRHGKYREGLSQRLGQVPPHLRSLPQNPTIWIHAVSVGEVLAITGVVQQLRQRLSDYRVLVSTTTATGQKLARTRFGDESVFYFPLDFGFAIQPYLSALRPKLVILAETEFWPNFLHRSKTQGASVAVINARISDRSLPGYLRVRRWLTRVLENVDLFLSQTEEDQNRLIKIGADRDRVRVSGNLKFDVTSPPAPAVVESLRQNFIESGAGPILVCGSTLETEEALLLSAFRNVLASHPKAVMSLAPRHPERFPEVAALLESVGMRFWRRSLLERRADRRRSPARRHHRRISSLSTNSAPLLLSAAASFSAVDTTLLSPRGMGYRSLSETTTKIFATSSNSSSVTTLFASLDQLSSPWYSWS